MDKLLSTIIGVVIAIGVSGVLFIGANMLFDQAPRRWKAFNAIVGGALGTLVYVILAGNRLIEWYFVPIGLVVGVGVGWLLGGIEDRTQRLALGLAGGGVLGLLAGLFLHETVDVFVARNQPNVEVGVFPALDWPGIIIWLAIGAAIGAGIWYARGRKTSILQPVVLWMTVGWMIAVWAIPDLGGGGRVEAIIGTTVVGLGFGGWAGMSPNATMSERDQMSRDSRKYIFLAPALSFIALSLVIPTIRTIYLSFLSVSNQSSEFIGLENYGDLFSDPGIVDLSGWSGIFGSKMFIIGIILLAVGLIGARIIGQRTGHAMQIGGGTGPAIALGVFLLVFAILANLRGTIFNNLWWVFTVTLTATALGLGIAVLADRARFESVAKSIIFLPMAISFVGAAIIWRFMYIARPPGEEQTGVLNAVWGWLGTTSQGGTTRVVITVILGLGILGLAYMAWRGYQAKATGVLAGSIVMMLPLIWFLWRLLGPGIGGIAIDADGVAGPDTVLFLQQSPFNNLWLMVVLIWIQTGFAMVIFSAAIKGVPNDLLEAAKVDGATESQTFWRVVIPQIATTIGVVVTTLIVLVMKVFDIVKVMTNGNFDTQVLANEMWQKAFTELAPGLGSAVAVVLFISVLPVMYINIRRMQRTAV